MENKLSSLFLRLNLKDVSKGLSVAIIVVVLGALQQAFTTHGLDVMAFDWNGIIDVAWKAAVAYLSKNLLSDSSGKFLGKIG